MAEIIVHRGRSVAVPVSVSYDISNDTITSEIREGRSDTTPLIVAWDVEFKTDGKDGDFILRLDDSVTQAISQSSGYMDIKRISNGEPTNIIDDPIEVIFKNTITD